MMARCANDARLDELFTGLKVEVPEICVSDLTTHSGNVVEGGLFLACQGYQHHGLEFLDKALAAKPAAVAWEPATGFAEPRLPENVIGVRVEGLASQVGDIADRFFSRPSQQLRVTGVTGTNGKTTTAWLVSRAMSMMGRTAAYMGTLGYGIGDQLSSSELTTPGCVVVHRRLRELADQGAECVVMEISSHGLDQGRVDAVRIQSAAFTNLSRDHLDYHGDLASYAAAKASLFDRAGLTSAVINTGDSFGSELVQRVGKDVDLISVAMKHFAAGDQARLTGDVVATGPAGLLLQLNGEFGSAELHSPMWGAFNAENLLLATGILLAEGFGLQDAAAALGQCVPPPGRMQVIRADHRPLAVIDFAHTPDALAKALQSIRQHCRGRVWAVFGCGGDRDRGKRAEMGAAASQYADQVVVTSDNPRHEDPQEIITDILSGITAEGSVQVDPDRRSAIKCALDAATPDDVVFVAGKGSEDYQLIGDRRLPFSDIVTVSEYLRGIGK